MTTTIGAAAALCTTSSPFFIAAIFIGFREILVERSAMSSAFLQGC